MDGLKDVAVVAQQYAETYAKEFISRVQPHLHSIKIHLEAWLANYTQLEVAAAALVAGIMFMVILVSLAQVLERVQQDGGFLRALFSFLRSLPFVKGKIAAEMKKARSQVLASLKTVSKCGAHMLVHACPHVRCVHEAFTPIWFVFP